MSKELKLVIDIERIEKEILLLKDEFEEEMYVTYGKSQEFGDKTLTIDEYNNNVDVFLSDFRKSITNIDSIIERFPKKKNGTFNRRNIRELASCDNCVAIHEWHNTWIYKVVKAYALDDTTIKVVLDEKVDTPA